jgi:hypothetical protein
MVRVPTPGEEDAKRIHREREHLVQEKLRIGNRIQGDMLYAPRESPLPERRRQNARSGHRRSIA